MSDESIFNVVSNENMVFLRTRYSPSVNTLTKGIEGRQYNQELKVFTFPISSMEKLKEVLDEKKIMYQLLTEQEYNEKIMIEKEQNPKKKFKPYTNEILPNVKVRQYSRHYFSVDLPIAGKYFYHLKNLKKIIHEDCWLIKHELLNEFEEICLNNDISFEKLD